MGVSALPAILALLTPVLLRAVLPPPRVPRRRKVRTLLGRRQEIGRIEIVLPTMPTRA